MATDILDLSLAYNCGATSHWAVRSYANAHQSGDVPNATMFGITDGPGFATGTFAGMRVCGTRDAGGVYNNYDLHFATHWGGVIAPTVMTMTCGGNVGIGTPTPSTILNIASSSPKIRLNPTTQNNPTAIEFGVLNAGTCAYAKIDAVNAQNYDTNLRFFTNNAGDATQVERMRITYNGYVGIGCTVPQTKLHVTDQAAYGIATFDSRTEGGYLILQQVGVTKAYIQWGLTIAGSSNGNYMLVTNDAICGSIALQTKSPTGTIYNSALVVGCTGNVGVGTCAPSYRLHVNGTFYAAGSSQDYKQSICNYNTDSCMFMKLKPVTYQYKEEYCHLGKELKSGTQIGLIAEEVAETYPELAILVNEEANKVVRNVDYEKLSVILLSEVQKLRQEVDQLKNK